MYLLLCFTNTLDDVDTQARELATPGLRSTVTSAQGQLAGLEEVLKKVAAAMGKVVARMMVMMMMMGKVVTRMMVMMMMMMMGKVVARMMVMMMMMMGKVVARMAEEETDMAEFARDLGNIGSSASVFGDNDFFFESSKEVARSETITENLYLYFYFSQKNFLALLQKLETWPNVKRPMFIRRCDFSFLCFYKSTGLGFL